MPFIFFWSLGQFSTMYFTIFLAIRFLSSSRKSRYQNRNACIGGEMLASALHWWLFRGASASTGEAAVDDEAVEAASDLAVEAADDLVEALGAAALVEASEIAGSTAFGKASACKASHCFLFIILLLRVQTQTYARAKQIKPVLNAMQSCRNHSATNWSKLSVYAKAHARIAISKGLIENIICQGSAVE
jgi:hypothetical protein